MHVILNVAVLKLENLNPKTLIFYNKSSLRTSLYSCGSLKNTLKLEV